MPEDLRATRTIEGVGEFTIDGEDMWEGIVDLDGSPVEVSLHTYGSDFKTIAEFARRTIAGKALPDDTMRDEIRSGLKSMEWKFKKYKFDPTNVEIKNFRIVSMVFGRDIDGPKLEHSVILEYPGDNSQWLLSYFDEGRGSLNWIPKTR